MAHISPGLVTWKKIARAGEERLYGSTRLVGDNDGVVSAEFGCHFVDLARLICGIIGQCEDFAGVRVHDHELRPVWP